MNITIGYCRNEGNFECFDRLDEKAVGIEESKEDVLNHVAHASFGEP